jgi:RimJ/RimL family protein N-acetyltransferase
MLDVAKRDPAIHAVTAQTDVDNTPSHRVLERNGFERTGTCIDPENGDRLISWRISFRLAE